MENRYRSVDLLSSFDDGVTWNVAARNLPNTGSALWTVPVVATDKALLAVVVIGGEGETGLTLVTELGTSDAFAISVPTDIGNRHYVFAMHGVAPNPARHGFTVNFSLPNGDAAMLEVFDVRGRQVASQQVGELGAGLHSVP